MLVKRISKSGKIPWKVQGSSSLISKYLIVRYHKDPIVEVDIGIGSKNLKLGLKNTKIENKALFKREEYYRVNPNST